MRMFLKGILTGMLEDEDAIFSEYIALEEKVRKRCKTLKGIWRVGKDRDWSAGIETSATGTPSSIARQAAAADA